MELFLPPVEAGEIAVAGKPLYRIADLSHMELRAYVTGDQLATLSIGQKVTVSTDNGSGGFNQQGRFHHLDQRRSRIHGPRPFQTKDERANLVYAIRISVPNDGKLKIGMYGEVSWYEKASLYITSLKPFRKAPCAEHCRV